MPAAKKEHSRNGGTRNMHSSVYAEPTALLLESQQLEEEIHERRIRVDTSMQASSMHVVSSVGSAQQISKAESSPVDSTGFHSEVETQRIVGRQGPYAMSMSSQQDLASEATEEKVINLAESKTVDEGTGNGGVTENLPLLNNAKEDSEVTLWG